MLTEKIQPQSGWEIVEPQLNNVCVVPKGENPFQTNHKTSYEVHHGLPLLTPVFLGLRSVSVLNPALTPVRAL